MKNKMEMENQEYVDPKSAFLLKLVNFVDSANWMIARGEYDNANRIFGSLLGMISIDGDGTEKLKELQRLAVYDFGRFLNSQNGEARIRQFEINQYLNATYFKDFKVAKPLQRKPSHIGVNQDE